MGNRGKALKEKKKTNERAREKTHLITG